MTTLLLRSHSQGSIEFRKEDVEYVSTTSSGTAYLRLPQSILAVESDEPDMGWHVFKNKIDSVMEVKSWRKVL